VGATDRAECRLFHRYVDVRSLGLLTTITVDWPCRSGVDADAVLTARSGIGGHGCSGRWALLAIGTAVDRSHGCPALYLRKPCCLGSRSRFGNVLLPRSDDSRNFSSHSGWGHESLFERPDGWRGASAAGLDVGRLADGLGMGVAWYRVGVWALLAVLAVFFPGCPRFRRLAQSEPSRQFMCKQSGDGRYPGWRAGRLIMGPAIAQRFMSLALVIASILDQPRYDPAYSRMDALALASDRDLRLRS